MANTLTFNSLILRMTEGVAGGDGECVVNGYGYVIITIVGCNRPKSAKETTKLTKPLRYDLSTL